MAQALGRSGHQPCAPSDQLANARRDPAELEEEWKREQGRRRRLRSQGWLGHVIIRTDSLGPACTAHTLLTVIQQQAARRCQTFSNQGQIDIGRDIASKLLGAAPPRGQRPPCSWFQQRQPPSSWQAERQYILRAGRAEGNILGTRASSAPGGRSQVHRVLGTQRDRAHLGNITCRQSRRAGWRTAYLSHRADTRPPGEEAAQTLGTNYLPQVKASQ